MRSIRLAGVNTSLATIAAAGLIAGAFLAASTSQAGPQAPTTNKKIEIYYHIAFSNPAPGSEEEYNRWYDNEHGPAVVAVPGFKTAQRYIASDVQVGGGQPPAKYAIVYSIETDDLAAVQTEFSRRIKSGEIVVSPTFQSGPNSGYYKALGPSVPHAGDAPAAPKDRSDSYLQFSFNNPMPGREDEFNQWMNTHHVHDIVGVPGYHEAQRLRATDARRPSAAGGYEYLTLYRITTDDMPALVTAFRQRVSSWFISPALGTNATYVYKTLGPTLDGDIIRAKKR